MYNPEKLTTQVTQDKEKQNKYTLENTEGQSKMDNLEKLTTQVTQDKEKQNNNTQQYVLDTAIRKQTQIT